MKSKTEEFRCKCGALVTRVLDRDRKKLCTACALNMHFGRFENKGSMITHL